MKHPLVENIERTHIGKDLILVDTKKLSIYLTNLLVAEIPFGIESLMTGPACFCYNVMVEAKSGEYSTAFTAEALMDMGSITEMASKVAEQLKTEIAYMILDAASRNCVLCPYVLVNAVAKNDLGEVHFEYRFGEVSKEDVYEANPI